MIVENAGLEGSVVVNEVKNGKGDYGYNARTEKYEKLFESGVIDPAKVTRVALENAASIAGMLLTTECVLCDIKEPEPAAPANPVWAEWAECTKPQGLVQTPSVRNGRNVLMNA